MSYKRELAENRTLQEVRLAYLASCGPSAAMIKEDKRKQSGRNDQHHRDC